MSLPATILTEDGLVRAEKLKLTVERIEALEAHKKSITEDIREVYKQAKEESMDTKTIRKIIKLRSMDERDIQEEEILLEAYKKALGMG